MDVLGMEGRQWNGCLVHRMEMLLRGMQQGSRVFHWSGPQAVAKLRRYLRLLKIPHASEFTLKAFRAGKATAMAAKGVGLQMILAAGEWKSHAFLNYVNEERAEALVSHNYGYGALDEGRVLQGALAESDDELEGNSAEN